VIRLPTASGLHRAMACPASCILPRCDVTSEDAQRGTIGHRFLERAAQIGRDAALIEAGAEDAKWLAEIDCDAIADLMGESMRHEIALSYEPVSDSAEYLLAKDRSYPHDGMRLFGTADVVLLGDEPQVWDYKFEGSESHTPPPSENLQLRFLALCVSRYLGVSQVRVGLVHITATGRVWREDATLDALDLDGMRADLLALVKRIETATPDHVSRGPHCRYCASVAACPSVVSLVRAAALEPVATAQGILEALTPETAAKAYARLAEVKAALAPVSQALAIYAESQPIALGNGRFYGPRSTTRESVSGAVAFDALAQLHGPAVARRAVDLDSSKAGIKRALADVAKERGVSLASLEREAVAAVRAAGGITTKTSVTVREYRDGKEE
jgi:hypothetical protein